MRKPPETFIGRPCRRGHRLRYRADKRCVTCRRAALREFYKQAMQGRKPQRWQLARKRAKARGAILYATGRPCINGHTSRRRVSTGICLACERYYRQHRSPAYRERERKGARERNRRAYRALRVLQHLGISI
jgi:hypothetical protein